MEIAKTSGKELKIKVKKGQILFDGGNKITLIGNVAKQPFVITEPGEYEVEGLSIFGYKAGESVSYVAHAEDLHVYIGSAKLDEKVIDEFDVIDVIILDVESGSAKELTTFVGKVEPSYILPAGDKEKIAQFIKEFEHTSRETEKLVISKSTMSEDVTEVVVLGRSV